MLQKSCASVAWTSVGCALFAEFDTHAATPHTPESRQSFVADTLVSDSAFGSDAHALANVTSQSDGLAHVLLAERAVPQKSAGAAAGLDLQPTSTTKRTTATLAQPKKSFTVS